MSGTFTINGQDTYATWGIILAPGSVDALLALPPAKEYVANESRLQDGVRVLTGSTAKPLDAARDVTLELHLLARDAADYKAKYGAFRAYIKAHRDLAVATEHSTDVFHFLYRSCNSFSDWNGRVSHIALSLWEPNPGNRTA